MSTEKPSVEGLMALVAQACSIAFDCGEAEDGGSMTKLSAAQEAIRTYATSLCAPSVEPEGWKLVPLEPTHEMLEAGAMRIAMNEQYVATAEAKAEAVWRDMLAASPSSSVLERARAVQDVLAERHRQDEKWGGPGHDDHHTVAEWVQLIEDYAGWARVMAGMNSPDKARRRLIQVAALAVAAVETIDRSALAEIDRALGGGNAE